MHRKKIFIEVISLSFLLGISIFVGIMAYLLWQVSYATSLTWIEAQFPQLYRLEYFAQKHLTRPRYELARWLIWLISGWLVIMWLLIFYHSSYYSAKLLRLVKAEQQYLRQAWRLLHPKSRKERRWLMYLWGVILVHRLYFFNHYAWHIDEITSYVFFVRQGFWVTAWYYPVPNNHFLANLLAWSLDLLSHNPVWVMRVPPLLVNFLTLLVLFAGSRYFFGFRVACLATLLNGLLLPSSIFAFYGRGYMLMSLWALWASFSLFQFMRDQRKIHLFHFSVASILGAYTVPVFLFPFLGMCLWVGAELWSVGQKKSLFSVILSIGVVGVGVALLYSPIFCLGGMEALTNDPYVMPKRWVDYWSQFPVAVAESMEWILGLPKRGYWALLLGIFPMIKILSSSQSNWYLASAWIRLLVWGLVAALLLVLWTRTFPPYRVWTYYTFWWGIGLAILIRWTMERLDWDIFKKERKLLFVLFLVSLASIAQYAYYQQTTAHQEAIARQKTKEIADEIYNHQPKNIYMVPSEIYLEEAIRWKYLQAEKPVCNFYTEASPQPPETYDYLILWKKEDWPAGQKPAQYEQIHILNGTLIYQNHHLNRE